MNDVDIRRENAVDRSGIRAVVARAFRSDMEADLVDRIRESSQYEPDLSLVALVDGVVVGHVMISGATLRTDDGDHPIMMLSPLAVEPDRHGRGIGTALVRAATARLAARGDAFVVLEGAPAYYQRFGFVPASEHGITMPLPDWAPLEAAQLLPLPAFEPSSTHGGGVVVYPATFDGLG